MAISIPNKYQVWPSSEQRERLKGIMRLGQEDPARADSSLERLPPRGRAAVQPGNRRAAGHTRRFGGPSASGLCWRGRAGARAQGARNACHPAEDQRSNRSPLDRHMLRSGARGPHTLDLGAFGRGIGKAAPGDERPRGIRTQDVKKTNSNLGVSNAGACSNTTPRVSSRKWKMPSISTRWNIRKKNRRFAWTRPANIFCATNTPSSPWHLAAMPARIITTSGAACKRFLCSSTPCVDGGECLATTAERVLTGRRIRRLLDEDCPNAREVKLVCDNLNTHDIALLYVAFPAEETHPPPPTPENPPDAAQRKLAERYGKRVGSAFATMP